MRRNKTIQKIILIASLLPIVDSGGDMHWRRSVEAAEYTSTVKSDLTLNDGDKITVNGGDDLARGISATGSTAAVTITNNGSSSIIAKNNTKGASGIHIDGGNVFTFGGTGKVEIKAEGSDAYGIFARGKSLTVSPAVNMEVTNSKDNLDCVGIYNWGSNSIFNGEVTVKLQTDYNVARAYGIENVAGNLTFNKNVDVSVITTKDLTNSWGYACAVETEYGKTTTFNGDVKAVIEGASPNAYMLGVVTLAGNSAADKSTMVFNGKTDISAVNTKGVAVALYAEQNAQIEVKDSIKLIANGIDTDNSLAAYASNGVIDVSKNILSVTAADAVTGQITGHIESNEGSTVNVNLTGADSRLDGYVATDESVTKLSTTALSLHNAAVWNNMGTSNVTDLNMTDGIINQDTDSGHTINIQNYDGSGTVNFQSTVTDGVSMAQGGALTVENAATGSQLTLSSVNNDSVNTLDKEQAVSSLNNLAEKLNYAGSDGQLNGKVVINEGLLTPWATADVAYDAAGKGYANFSSINTGGNTSTMSAMKNIASVNIISWRQENNDLNKRLGELRAGSGESGIWARMYRGEFEYGGAYKNQYNSFQLGYDKKILTDADGAVWNFGAAVSHTSAATAYAEGKGENSSTGLAIYGTWLGSKGHYLDLIAKHSRLTTDYDNYAAAGHTHGDYRNWGTSLSAEYGRKIELCADWFIEPQAELTLGRVSSASYVTNNDISVRQDGLTSSVGRIGFRIGKELGNGSLVYARASLLHEFSGEAATYLSMNNIDADYRQDIGSTWYEAGIGANFKVSRTLQGYADIEKTFGGSVKTPWQWNMGLRWSF